MVKSGRSSVPRRGSATRHPVYDSRAYRRALATIKATGPACVLCHHPGSDSIHHQLATSLYPEVADDPANWLPAHGVAGCPVCRKACNQEQGNRLTPKRDHRSRRW